MPKQSIIGLHLQLHLILVERVRPVLLKVSLSVITKRTKVLEQVRAALLSCQVDSYLGHTILVLRVTDLIIFVVFSKTLSLDQSISKGIKLFIDIGVFVAFEHDIDTSGAVIQLATKVLWEFKLPRALLVVGW